MTCPDCRQAELVETRENIRYTESGLPYVTLCDILVERCPACGNTLVNIPEMEQLHRLLANIVSRSPVAWSLSRLPFCVYPWAGQRRTSPGTCTCAPAR